MFFEVECSVLIFSVMEESNEKYFYASRTSWSALMSNRKAVFIKYFFQKMLNKNLRFPPWVSEASLLRFYFLTFFSSSKTIVWNCVFRVHRARSNRKVKYQIFISISIKTKNSSYQIRFLTDRKIASSAFRRTHSFASFRGAQYHRSA